MNAKVFLGVGSHIDLGIAHLIAVSHVNKRVRDAFRIKGWVSTASRRVGPDSVE